MILSISQPVVTFRHQALALSLIAMHPRTLAYTRVLVATTVGIGLGMVGVMVMWHLWLRSKRGNSNYFYFQCLVYHVFQCILVTSFIGAEVKRNKVIRLGEKRCASIIRMFVRRSVRRSVGRSVTHEPTATMEGKAK